MARSHWVAGVAVAGSGDFPCFASATDVEACCILKSKYKANTSLTEMMFHVGAGKTLRDRRDVD